MSGRELVVLGTASQVPTRHRNHNGYLLRWDGEGVLFDPGEGTQRQLTLAGVAASAITRICITHLHGDHCLGLPGVLQRLSLDGVRHPVHLYFPASGGEYVDRLRHASIAEISLDVRLHPVASDGVVDIGPAFRVVARRLDHRVDSVGWRIEEPDGRRMLPDRLDAAGVHGPDIGRLQRTGEVDVDGRTVWLEDVSEPRRGQAMAFVMDTRRCDAAVSLARNADLVVCESTYAEPEAELAARHGHMTATDAARVARDAGARLLVLAHYSSRYPDEEVLADEARSTFGEVVAARDLLTIPLPSRDR